MQRAHDVETVRDAERSAMAALPEGSLMDRAAAGLAAVLLRVLRQDGRPAYGRRVVLLVGPGDNGGDALLAGARLARRGVRVEALLLTPRAHPRGLAALAAAGGTVVTDPAVLRRADLVVDGLLGIGARAGLTGRAADWARLLDDGAVPVVAVDLPSGVDPGTGELDGVHVRADLTVTFGTLKPALLLPPASRVAGLVELVDIGMHPAPAAVVERLEPADLAALWPMPGAADDKYRRGVVGVVAGGSTYPGAAVLCTGAAVRSGAGMVRYVGPPAATDLVRARWPEVVPGQGRVQAWVLGPGVDVSDETRAGAEGQREAVEQALASDLPCVVDAGALGLLGSRRDAPTLLTPHAGELARLLGAHGEPVERSAVEAAPARCARRAAELTGATVLLKGAVILVVGPDGPVRSQAEGPHWLATAGSGDVLAGIAGTLLAAGLDPLDAAPLAVAAHGRAGALASAGGPVSASSVLDAVPSAVRALLTGEPPH